MSAPTAVTVRLCQRDVSGAATHVPVCHRRTLADVSDGEAVRVIGVCDEAHPEVARRLFDLGFMPGADAVRLRHAPMGDPIVVRVADYEIALRRSQAASIVVADPATISLGMPLSRPGEAGAGTACAECGR